MRRKASSTKRLSPAPSTQTSYYSESMMSESYLGGSRGLAALGTSGLDDPLDRSIYWGEPVLIHQLGCWGAPSCFWGGWILGGLRGVDFYVGGCRWGVLHEEEKRHRGHGVQ